jgi:hypothetical protein
MQRLFITVKRGIVRNWSPLAFIGYSWILCMPVACGVDRRAEVASASSDSAYADVQHRGEAVMGVDQYTSKHVFEDLPDGGRILLERDDATDTAAISQIRAHMREVASDFTNGNFAKPFAVHAMALPGTQVMTALKAEIEYTAVDRARGAEVRITSSAPAAIDAVHRFLAFQRSDHRAAGSESMESHTR